MMDENYGEDPQAPMMDQAHKPDEEKGEGKTFLVDKSICPGMKVGEEMVSRIVAIHEHEYELEYAPEEGSETPPESEPEPGMEKASMPGSSDSMYS